MFGYDSAVQMVGLGIKWNLLLFYFGSKEFAHVTTSISWARSQIGNTYNVSLLCFEISYEIIKICIKYNHPTQRIEKLRDWNLL